MGRPWRGLGVEALLLLALLALYRWGRLLADTGGDEAQAHAQQIWSSQQSLDVPPETGHQRILLRHPVIAQAANGYDAWVHFPLTALVLVWLHRRRPRTYRVTRTALVLATTAGLLLAFAYPLAPPRPTTGLGFVDVAALFGQSVYGGAAAGASNQFAVMPSLHVGWAMLLAVALSSAHPAPLLCPLWWAHPVLTVLVVVATGNHFWADAVAGAVLVVVAWVLVARLVGDDPGRTGPSGPGPDGPRLLPQDEARVLPLDDDPGARCAEAG